MAQDIWYGVHLFVRTKDKRRVALAETRDSSSAEAARDLAARSVAEELADGAIAYSRTVDYDLGEYDEPVILARVGHCPEDALEAA